ncbi:peptide-N4-asparagine amidase A [Streptomyces sp. NA04227]|uniref:peptide-N4-asparagine amidase n=1 Tax=Streptomyces sp. NA04227 TaxID=2742136 RepID=UPI001591001F|nr:peptide-N4-asparagine amidase [Streptomyces sp. NA04227]QKW05296.1 peptide-N4-asparagine amidase A [Streptomyces sp. NA04227]
MRRRFVMPMLVAVLLSAGLLPSGAGPATAAERSTAPAPAAEPPPEFGTDWHDPVTAAPPVTKPQGKACEVTVAETEFRDFTPYRGRYTPPEGCGDRWGKVVLRLEGSVKGRQFDRLGYLHIGGVEVLRTSTPQPSPDGITWSVEKDVTRYRDVLRRGQDVEMLIGNVVDETYTGVIKVRAKLTFYATGRDATSQGATSPGATSPGRGSGEVPDRVLPLRDGKLTTPRNSERILAEVYATGSGGGCEEYWYLTVPDAAPYSCKADGGPYREVQITVDGRLAGIASPFPTVWTGGWSNPFLWYVIPGPRAFDIQPIVYDLTPFAGLLNDGRPHDVDVRVVGVPEGQTGWSLPTNVLLWQDEKSEQVTGALTTHRESSPTNSSEHTPGSTHRLDTEGAHALEVAGYVDTSHGRVRTTVDRAVDNSSVHRWTESESYDGLRAVWHDEETVTTSGRGAEREKHLRRTYTMDGTTTLGEGDRLRTVLALGDRHSAEETLGGRRVSWSALDDGYEGDATYTVNVPRDQRHAVGTTSERLRLLGSDGCDDRHLVTVQGMVTRDDKRC